MLERDRQVAVAAPAAHAGQRLADRRQLPASRQRSRPSTPARHHVENN